LQRLAVQRRAGRPEIAPLEADRYATGFNAHHGARRHQV
jgi:hypothetical protein